MYFITLRKSIRKHIQIQAIYRFNGKITKLKEKPDPRNIPQDYVGAPDKLSNIRSYIRHVPKNESILECRLRNMQDEVEKWNHGFWSRHNERFFCEREDFVNASMSGNKTEVSADKMSEFYKSFLDKNRGTHIRYNYLWYLKNCEMLKLSFRVYIERLLKKFK
ncbi:COA8 family protein CG14806, mitochondrial isoform X1 [Anastrepha obliqua]|uniref:COA8 family protein CG14806, mitochondrial isoform X1 n=1 Tax=Anastrepha obliqua TaxID=95512 RepID=UPI0024096C2C|nr:COA8 family protein CG14806, mitochondrial isoform X1 [Anastrepha obliqua]